jgi:hypothetical protein
MEMVDHDLAHLRAIVLQDLESADEGSRTAFRGEFGVQLSTFASDTATALNAWSSFLERLDDSNVRGIRVAAIVFTTINHNVTSYKPFYRRLHSGIGESFSPSTLGRESRPALLHKYPPRA